MIRPVNSRRRAWRLALISALLLAGGGAVLQRDPFRPAAAVEAPVAALLPRVEATAALPAPPDPSPGRSDPGLSHYARGEPLLTEVFPADPQGLRELLEPPARRLRYVTFPQDLFNSKQSPFWPRPGDPPLELNLFEDFSVPIRVERTEVLGPDRYVAEGVIPGRPGSRALFAFRDGALSATVEDLEWGRYAINTASGGIHQVYEIDPELVPFCGGFVLPQLDADFFSQYGDGISAGATGGGASMEAAENPAHGPVAITHVMFVYSMELYSLGLSDAAIQSRIDLAVQEVNSDFQRSHVRARVELAYAGPVNASETGSLSTALDRLRRTSDGFMDEVHAIRDQVGADLVCLLVRQSSNNTAGIAYLLDRPNHFANQAYGFSVVRYTYVTGSNTLTHELGHNFGCAHDRDNATSAGSYPYSYGYRFTDSSGGRYRTIMAYSPGQRVSYFSNPTLTLPVAGSPALGVQAGHSGEADNSWTISQNAFEVSNYRLAVAEDVARGQLINVSTRAFVGAGNRVLIGGFVIGGKAPKKVLVRAVGPSLTKYGLSGALSDPVIRLMRGSQTVATNTSWVSSPQAGAIQESGFAPTDGREPAILANLDPGAYTVIVEGHLGTTGLGLVEVFELDRAGPKLVNLSTRGWVGTGNHVMIGGFIVEGSPNETKRILIRALGPSLTQHGVTEPLEDPALRLYSEDGSLLLDNDDWDFSNQQQAIRNAGLAPGNRRESAMIIDLLPGAYTAIVRPFENQSGTKPGVGLVEVYEIVP